MVRRVLGLAGGVLLAAGVWGQPMAANININTGTMYQTVEGFGAFASISPWKLKIGPFYYNINLDSVGFYDSMVTELGATMFRTGVPSDGFEPSAGNFNRGAASGTANTIRKLVASANRNGEPIRFISSCWSPPGWMKVGGIAACGVEAAPPLSGTTCKLSTGMEDDLGRHFAEWVDVIKDSTGVDLYALSIQNEPAFSEPYESCVYDGPRYRDVLKIAAPIVRGVSSTIRFFGAEHMSWAFPNAFESYIRNDGTALGYMHAWAVHGYTNGVQTDTGAYQGSTPTDKVFWMTETSGGGYGSGYNDWNGAMTLARNILGYLRNGRMTAWVWWSLQDLCNGGQPGCETTEPGEYCLIINGTKTAKYYASSHIYRFVRPGARQIVSSSDDGQVQVVAFRHVANNCVSIVLINTGTASKTINVTGTGVPGSFELHVSTEASKRVMSSVGNSGITIPATSVATLVSGSYRSTLPVRAEQPGQGRSGVTPAAERTLRVSWYTLSGKLLPVEALKGLTSGMTVIERSVRADGRTVSRMVQVAR